MDSGVKQECTTLKGDHIRAEYVFGCREYQYITMWHHIFYTCTCFDLFQQDSTYKMDVRFSLNLIMFVLNGKYIES